ncbi:uncharacterized protein [Panulirus ornatus]|uniref:uncharacterized protein n=1 Tax=Panulirus ornatus TaxID=150431 RepID=UPI003A86C81A
MLRKRSVGDPNLTAMTLAKTMRPFVLHTMAILLLRGTEAYDPEASITGLYTGPYFDPLAPRNMTAHLGDEATLPCTVRQLGDKSVSWVRMRDADILTVDRYTFVGDERFESHYSSSTETWNLVIKYVQERDAGLYECQVSTEPKMSQLFSLRVVIPKVMIVPEGDRYVKAGSTVRVDCQITDVVQLPDYIFWYHGDKRVMDIHDPNLLVTVKRTGVEAITSTLTIHKVRQEQSGNYTCMPSNLHAASVTLHVLNEKHPAAMQGERNGACTSEAKMNVTLGVLLFVLVCTVSFGLNEENSESAAAKERRPLDLASSSSPKSPAVSSSSSVSLRSNASFSPVDPGADSAVIFDQDKRRTTEILRDLVKEEVLHLAREVLAEGPEGQVLATKDQRRLPPSPVSVGNPTWRPLALQHLARTRVALGVEGHSLTHFWNRQDPLVATLDEAPALPHIEEEEEMEEEEGEEEEVDKEEEEEEGEKEEEEEEEEEGLVVLLVVVVASLQMNPTKPTADPSKKQLVSSSVANVNSCRSCGRWMLVARTR